jgi:hypothetical protein
MRELCELRRVLHAVIVAEARPHPSPIVCDALDHATPELLVTDPIARANVDGLGSRLSPWRRGQRGRIRRRTCSLQSSRAGERRPG